MQRAGRAGREVCSSLSLAAPLVHFSPKGPGYCFRLYTEEAFQSMAVTSEPEIRRCSLTSSMLQMRCVGQDMTELDFMDKPDEDSREPNSRFYHLDQN